MAGAMLRLRVLGLPYPRDFGDGAPESNSEASVLEAGMDQGARLLPRGGQDLQRRRLDAG